MKILAKVQSPIPWLVILMSLISCQKEVPRKLKPAIKLSAAKNTACVGERVPISVQLEGIDHRFQIVERDSKRGTVSDRYGKTKADWSTDRSQKATFYFTAMEQGIHELRFRAVDHANQSAAATLKLTVKPHAFKVEAHSEQEEISTNKSVDVTLHIEDTIGAHFPKNLLCQSDLKGTFTIEGKPYTGEIPVFIGAKKDVAIRFNALQSGRTTLRFTVSDTLKNTQTVSTPLTVTDPTFTVKLTAEQDTIYVNETAEMQLEIADEEDTQKTLSCYSDSGDSLTVGNKPCTGDSPIAIGAKDKIDGIVFKPAKIGIAHLRFILHDTYQDKESWVTIHTQGVPFDVQLTARPDQGAKLAKQDTLKIQVLPKGDASGISYHWTYKAEGTGAGTLTALPKTGPPYPIEPYKPIPYIYQVNRETGPEPSGKHTISITVKDNYGQAVTQSLDFNVVRFPIINHARSDHPDFYYEAQNATFSSTERLIRIQYVTGKRGDYAIDSIRVKVSNCRAQGGNDIDKMFPYDPNGKVFTLYDKTKSHKEYMKHCGCETKEARATFWLIDSQGNMSRPFTTELRKS